MRPSETTPTEMLAKVERDIQGIKAKVLLAGALVDYADGSNPPNAMFDVNLSDAAGFIKEIAERCEQVLREIDVWRLEQYKHRREGSDATQ